MSEKLLTVAVPAYNAEEYLHTCLDSLCREDILPRLEVIVVNDGSKDRTSEFAHGYAARYPDTFRVIDKENGGHGSGINLASREARGRYFKPVDSDDWVLTENLPTLLKKLEKANDDILLCPYHVLYRKTGRKVFFTTEGAPPDISYPIERFMGFPDRARRCCTYHGVFYRTDFYKNTGIRLSEHTYYEDQEYATLPFYDAQSIRPLDIPFYQYQIGSASQSVSNANQGRNLQQMVRVLRVILRFYQEHGDMSAGKKDYFLYKLSDALLSCYASALLRSGDRKAGRIAAVQIHRGVSRECPELAEYTEKRYRTAVWMHRLHITADRLDGIKGSRFYDALRRRL